MVSVDRLKGIELGELMDIYPNEVLIKNCLVGRNLNLAVIRGFSSLDFLSDISSADVFDQTHNKWGTQRELQPKHAREASEYAFDSISANPLVDPRAFTEVILNVRDLATVTILRNGQELDFLSVSSDINDSEPVDLLIRTNAIQLPQPKYAPQISRVDGNHRLSEIPSHAEREGMTFPSVPFAMFIGLSTDHERKIFRDINGNQAKMNTAHLAQIKITLEGDNALLDPKTRGLWFAKALSAPGMAFEGMVFEGGAKAGIKEALGTVPPITLNGLQSMMNETLRRMEGFQAELFPPEDVALAKSGDELAFANILANGEKLANVIDRFWKAIKSVFSEPWQDKKNFILLQSIGYQATSSFAAILIADLVKEHKVQQADFEKELNKIKHAGFTYAKEEFQGYAGAAGASKVFEKLLAKRVEGGEKILPALN